jgi:hypothetical protein
MVKAWKQAQAHLRTTRCRKQHLGVRVQATRPRNQRPRNNRPAPRVSAKINPRNPAATLHTTTTPPMAPALEMVETTAARAGARMQNAASRPQQAMAMHPQSETQRPQEEAPPPCHAWNPMSRARCKQCHAMNPDLVAGRGQEESEEISSGASSSERHSSSPAATAPVTPQPWSKPPTRPTCATPNSQ